MSAISYPLTKLKFPDLNDTGTIFVCVRRSEMNSPLDRDFAEFKFSTQDKICKYGAADLSPNFRVRFRKYLYVITTQTNVNLSINCIHVNQTNLNL